MAKFLVVPDCHVPFHDKRALGAVLNYAAGEEWTGVIQLGDFIDANPVSSHNLGKPRLVEGERIKKDYDVANSVLDDLTEAVRKRNKAASVTILAGNHEYRIERFIDANPALEGLIEPEIGMRFKERGVRYIRCYPDGDILKIGHLYFTHGAWATKNCARKHVEEYGVNIVMGHSHRVGVSPRVTLGKGKPLMGVNLGCLCRLDMPYLLGTPTDWLHAIGVVHVRDDGTFNIYPAIILGGVFTSPEGRLISYRDKAKGVSSKKVRSLV